MKFSFTQALLCLLSFGPAIGSAKPLANPYPPLALNTPAGGPLENDITNENGTSTHTPWVKRVPGPPVVLSKRPQWGDTWFGHVREPAGSGWTENTIRGMTRQAFESRACYHPEKFIVAALWVQGEGVWFGSTVQGAGQETLKNQAPTFAPRLWGEIRFRRKTDKRLPPPALYHAEDAASFWYESNQLQGARPNSYPMGPTKMYVYGFRFTEEPVGRREPCGGPNARIDPSCLYVLTRQLDVGLM
jgi:hypothetical protein